MGERGVGNGQQWGRNRVGAIVGGWVNSGGQQLGQQWGSTVGLGLRGGQLRLVTPADTFRFHRDYLPVPSPDKGGGLGCGAPCKM